MKIPPGKSGRPRVYRQGRDETVDRATSCQRCRGFRSWDYETKAWACWNCGAREYTGVMSDEPSRRRETVLFGAGLRHVRKLGKMGQ